MRRGLLVLLLIAGTGLFFAGNLLWPPQASVTNARVRLPAAPGLPAAGYFDLDMGSSQEVLRGVSSPAAQRIEMHLTVEENGMSRMVPVPEVSGHRAHDVKFEPGGRHLMIFGLDPDLRAGATIPLTLTFIKSPPVTVEARLETPGGIDHAGH